MGAKKQLNIAIIVSQSVKRVPLQDEQAFASEAGESTQSPSEKHRVWRFTASMVHENLLLIG